jgi:hypothetical protein
MLVSSGSSGPLMFGSFAPRLPRSITKESTIIRNYSANVIRTASRNFVLAVAGSCLGAGLVALTGFALKKF